MSDGPRLTYLICSEPRVGSSLLAEALAGTSVAGRPAEYFHNDVHHDAALRHVLEVSGDHEYIGMVIKNATTPNGVCGLKVHWDQMPIFCGKLVRHLNSKPGTITNGVLAELIQRGFGDVRYVWLRRRNRVLQGISHYRAVETQIWRVKCHEASEIRPPSLVPAYCFEKIAASVERCDAQDRAWAKYFLVNQIKPLVVIYEDFIQTYEQTARSVLRHIGLPDDGVSIIEPAYERQADAISFAWERSYRAEINGRQPGTDAVKYFICGSPRAGTTLLADALAATGVAGIPDEHFAAAREHDREYWVRRLGVRSLNEYVDRVVDAGSTPNGVFGTKLHWHHNNCLVEMLGRALGQQESDGRPETLEKMIRRKFGSPRYIWLRRKNMIAQGISLYRASRTAVWRVVKGRDDQANVPDQMLEFNHDEIARCVNRVTKYDWQWNNYFRRNRLAPLMVYYEDLAEHYDTTIRGILMFLGLPHENVTIAAPALERQSNERSLLWERWYRDRTAPESRTAPLESGASVPASAEPSAVAPIVQTIPLISSVRDLQSGRRASRAQRLAHPAMFHTVRA